MSLLINHRRVIDSGTIVTVNDEAIQYQDTANRFVVNFCFSSDSEARQERIVPSIENNQLTLTFVNFVSAIGITNRTPIIIGSIGSVRILLNFCLATREDKGNLRSRILNFTFMEENMSEGAQ